VVSFLGRRQRLVFYESDGIFNPVVCSSVQEGSLCLHSVSISGRGWVMRLLFWDKLEPFVTVINRNGRCKPKFILGSSSFVLQPVL